MATVSIPAVPSHFVNSDDASQLLTERSLHTICRISPVPPTRTSGYFRSNISLSMKPPVLAVKVLVPITVNVVPSHLNPPRLWAVFSLAAPRILIVLPEIGLVRAWIHVWSVEPMATVVIVPQVFGAVNVRYARLFGAVLPSRRPLLPDASHAKSNERKLTWPMAPCVSRFAQALPVQ